MANRVLLPIFLILASVAVCQAEPPPIRRASGVEVAQRTNNNNNFVGDRGRDEVSRSPNTEGDHRTERVEDPLIEPDSRTLNGQLGEGIQEEYGRRNDFSKNDRGGYSHDATKDRRRINDVGNGSSIKESRRRNRIEESTEETRTQHLDDESLPRRGSSGNYHKEHVDNNPAEYIYLKIIPRKKDGNSLSKQSNKERSAYLVDPGVAAAENLDDRSGSYKQSTTSDHHRSNSKERDNLSSANSGESLIDVDGEHPAKQRQGRLYINADDPNDRDHFDEDVHRERHGNLPSAKNQIRPQQSSQENDPKERNENVHHDRYQSDHGRRYQQGISKQQQSISKHQQAPAQRHDEFGERKSSDRRDYQDDNETRQPIGRERRYEGRLVSEEIRGGNGRNGERMREKNERNYKSKRPDVKRYTVENEPDNRRKETNQIERNNVNDQQEELKISNSRHIQELKSQNTEDFPLYKQPVRVAKRPAVSDVRRPLLEKVHLQPGQQKRHDREMPSADAVNSRTNGEVKLNSDSLKTRRKITEPIRAETVNDSSQIRVEEQKLIPKVYPLYNTIFNLKRHSGAQLLPKRPATKNTNQIRNADQQEEKASSAPAAAASQLSKVPSSQLKPPGLRENSNIIPVSVPSKEKRRRSKKKPAKRIPSPSRSSANRDIHHSRATAPESVRHSRGPAASGSNEEPPRDQSAKGGQQVALVAHKPLSTAATDEGHGKGKNEEKGHHKSHKSAHKKIDGNKGNKGHTEKKGHKKVHEGDYNKKHKKSHHDKGGVYHKDDHHDEHHKGSYEKGEKGIKGYKKGKKMHHHKGHKDKGFKATHHKKEFVLKKEHYEDFDNKEYHGEHDHFDKFFEDFKKGMFKADSSKGEKHHDKHHKDGHHKKGHHLHHDKGHDKHYDHDSHHDHHEEHGHEKGHHEKHGHDDHGHR